MSAKFELKKAKNDKIYFNLCSGNGEIVLTSQMYASKATAKNGIKSIQTHCGDKERYVLSDAKGGKSRFVLRSANNKVIGSSQSYTSAASAKAGIKSVMSSGKKAKIVDETK